MFVCCGHGLLFVLRVQRARSGGMHSTKRCLSVFIYAWTSASAWGDAVIIKYVYIYSHLSGFALC